MLVLAPPAIDREIRTLRRNSGQISDQAPNMQDVLRWLFKQTVRNLAISMPGWVEQGLSHRKRRLAANALGMHDQVTKLEALSEADIRTFLNAWEEQEAKSLQSLYSPARGSQLLEWMNPKDAVLASDEIYQEIVGIGRNVSLHDHDIASRQQLYQREVQLQAVVTRHTERPAKALPESPILHPDMRTFVQTGEISLASPATIDIAHAVQKCSFGNASKQLPDAWSPGLRISLDFMTTVESHSTLDLYANPVNWVLTTNPKLKSRTWIVISPFEANALIDQVRSSTCVRLHVYAPTIRRIRPFAADTLQLFSISGTNAVFEPDPVLKRELALFAGGCISVVTPSTASC